MKQFNPVQKVIGGTTFYIRPLPAFKAANVSGELAAVITPLLGAITPAALKENSDSIFDADLAEAAPAIAGAFASLSGDKLEHLMKSLLTDYGTIAFETEEDTSPRKLTEDLCNDLFCGNAQNMFVLAFHVIGVNFGDFFDGLKDRFGTVLGQLENQTD